MSFDPDADTGSSGNVDVVLEPDLAIIDAHHHIGKRPAPEPSYLLENYLADAADHNIVATCDVGEVSYGNMVADQAAHGDCRVAAAIIETANIDGLPDVGAFLDHAIEIAPARFRGMRSVAMYHPDPAALKYWGGRTPPGAGQLQAPALKRALQELARRDLHFEVAIYDNSLAQVAEIAAAWPNMPIVLQQMGQPMMAGMDERARLALLPEWRAAVRKLANHPNVLCKISGLGLPFWEFGFETRDPKPSYLELADAWRPWIDGVIDAFGPERCLMGSNFPPDRMSCTFTGLWNAFKHYARDYSPDEKAALFAGTASRLYRIEMTTRP